MLMEMIQPSELKVPCARLSGLDTTVPMVIAYCHTIGACCVGAGGEQLYAVKFPNETPSLFSKEMLEQKEFTGFVKMKSDHKQRATCLSCEDLIGQSKDEKPEVQDAMTVYCRVCAYEILGLAIPKYGTLQSYSGHKYRVVRETKTH